MQIIRIKKFELLLIFIMNNEYKINGKERLQLHARINIKLATCTKLRKLYIFLFCLLPSGEQVLDKSRT